MTNTQTDILESLTAARIVDQHGYEVRVLDDGTVQAWTVRLNRADFHAPLASDWHSVPNTRDALMAWLGEDVS